ncbi:MAG: hypothetical protein KY460_16585 [Actinobacteria bacterium]|nr:hypothetical protein [Actinomycetota bacterium]
MQECGHGITWGEALTFNAEDTGAAVAPSEDAGYNLAFQTEQHYVRPVWPTEDDRPQMSMHRLLEVDDLEEAVAHAVDVGAEVADHQPQDAVRVMLDPAGHPFCLYVDTDDWAVSACALIRTTPTLLPSRLRPATPSLGHHKPPRSAFSVV